MNPGPGLTWLLVLIACTFAVWGLTALFAFLDLCADRANHRAAARAVPKREPAAIDGWRSL